MKITKLFSYTYFIFLLIGCKNNNPTQLKKEKSSKKISTALQLYSLAIFIISFQSCSVTGITDNLPAFFSANSVILSFAFIDFIIERDPKVYEFSSIDMTQKRQISKELDYFTLMEYSAKWDPIPSMLNQNHTVLVKGFMGQTTSYSRDLVKSNVLVMGENKSNGEARYIHGIKGQGFFTFYGGHDPEDYTHRVGDPKTELDLHPTSPGYRLILNNVLFPAARKKKQKT